MKTWFTSDTHFNHANIIRYCNRPFNSVEHMNGALLFIWNDRVKPNDRVIFLGDFGFFKDPSQVSYFLSLLNGSKVLITGNHDNRSITKCPGWAFVSDLYELDEVVDTGDGETETQHIVCCHYPMRSWNKMSRGAYMLHGHCHGTIDPIDHSFDVGVDSTWTNFGPVDIHDIMKHQFDIFGMAPREKVEHHD